MIHPNGNPPIKQPFGVYQARVGQFPGPPAGGSGVDRKGKSADLRIEGVPMTYSKSFVFVCLIIQYDSTAIIR